MSDNNYTFDQIEFMAFLEGTFVGYDNCIQRGMAENIVYYGLKQNKEKDDFVKWLLMFIPEITEDDIEPFIERKDNTK